MQIWRVVQATGDTFLGAQFETEDVPPTPEEVTEKLALCRPNGTKHTFISVYPYGLYYRYWSSAVSVVIKPATKYLTLSEEYHQGGKQCIF